MSASEPHATADGILYSGTLRPYAGMPNAWGPEPRARAHADLDLCRRLIGEERHRAYVENLDPTADIEDCWEDIARMAAAVRAADAVGRPIEQRHSAVWTADELSRRLGPIWTAEEGAHSRDELMFHPLLLQHGGRQLTPCGYFTESDLTHRAHIGVPPCTPNLLDHLETMRDAGEKLAVVKTAPRKSGVAAIELARGDRRLSRDEIDAQLWQEEAFGWSMESFGNKDGFFLAQTYVPMTFEYRFFVVEGRVISGAACIEEHTPYDRASEYLCFVDGIGFDGRVRRVRGIIAGQRASTEGVTRLPRIVRTLVERAMQLAADYPGTYVVDLAIHARTGDVVVVELNDLPNSGLYASDTDAVQLATALARDRGYGAV